MRITIGINDQIMARLLAVTEAANKTRAIQIAITEFLKKKGKSKLLQMKGRLHLENNWKKLREGELNE